MLDLESEEGTIQFYKNYVQQAIRGVRPNSLRRLLVLDRLLDYEYFEAQGSVYERWVNTDPPAMTKTKFIHALNVEGFYLLEDSASALLGESDLEFIFGISERTAQDYVKTIRMFYL